VRPGAVSLSPAQIRFRSGSRMRRCHRPIVPLAGWATRCGDRERSHPRDPRVRQPVRAVAPPAVRPCALVCCPRRGIYS
jgi:hypothetical protein